MRFWEGKSAGAGADKISQIPAGAGRVWNLRVWGGSGQWFQPEQDTGMGVGRGEVVGLAPWLWKFSEKKVVFLVSSGKNQNSPHVGPPDKI